MQVDFDWISGLAVGIEAGAAYEMDDDGNIDDSSVVENITVSLGFFRMEIYFGGGDGGKPVEKHP